MTAKNENSLLLNLFAIRHVRAYPVLASGLARSSGTRVDRLGRELSLSEPPLPVYFLNAKPDRKILKDNSDIRLDYILGDSDPDDKLVDGDFIYWIPGHTESKHDLENGDGVLVEFNIANDAGPSDEAGNNWYCFRRVYFSSLEGSEALGPDEVFIRTKVDDEICEKRITVTEIAGVVTSEHYGGSKVVGIVPSEKLPI